MTSVHRDNVYEFTGSRCHLNITGSACDFEVYLALVQNYCINIKMVNIIIIRFEVFDQWISDFGNEAE